MLDGDITEAALIQELQAPFSTNKYVEWGWAVETAVQRASETGDTSPYTWHNARHEPTIPGSRPTWVVQSEVIASYIDLDCRPPMWQTKTERVHKGITVVGVLDGISGYTGYEIKTTSNDDELYERFRDSWQHRIYYWLFGIRCMHYFVGVFRWPEGGLPIHRYTTDFVLYPTADNDKAVMGMVEIFVDWRKSKGI
jgi:hypothetical protein